MISKRRTLEIYIEGGGATPRQRAPLRVAFTALFAEVSAKIEKKNWKLQLTLLGSGSEAFKAFSADARRLKHGDALLLLIDAEYPLSTDPLEHIRTRLKWPTDGLPPEDIHLMVQTMETWLVSNPTALADFYGPGFRADKLPQRTALEEEPKADCLHKLEQASAGARAGKYHKGDHSAKLLKRLRWSDICTRLPSAARLHQRVALVTGVTE